MDHRLPGPQFSPHDLAPWCVEPSMDTDRPTTVGRAVPASHFPLPGWPAASTVEYLTKLILLGLLLLALPYLIGKALTSPGVVLAAAGRAAR
jgi:hypothetical protein